MSDSGEPQKDFFRHTLSGLSVQADLHKKMAQSRPTNLYLAAVEKS